jgi:hypothetical protein
MRTKTLQREHKTYLNRHVANARKGNLDYTSLTSKLNRQFGTRFSVYQVAGYMGRRIQLINS